MNDVIERHLDNSVKMIKEVLGISPPPGYYDKTAFVTLHKNALHEAVQHQLKCSYDVFAGVVKVYSFDNRIFIAALTEQDAIDFYVDPYDGWLLPTIGVVESDVLKERRLIMPVLSPGEAGYLDYKRYKHLHNTYNRNNQDYSLIPAEDILMQDWNGSPIVLWEEQA